MVLFYGNEEITVFSYNNFVNFTEPCEIFTKYVFSVL